MTKAQPQAPWQRGNPKPDAAHQALSPQAKAAARRRARKAGRPYPNLVDNMYEAQHTDGKPPAGKKAAAKKTAAKAPSAKKSAAKKATAATTAKATRKAAAKTADKPARKAAAAPAKKAATTKPAAKTTRDPQGGLTAAGRVEFARKDGAQLKPGVTKAIADMTPEEMRRKGSWAVRFYGRETLPPLQKANGEPTRFALSAHAWGEPVPKTEAQARKIAEKGERLLKRYEAAKAKKAKAQNKTPAATKAKR